MATSSYRVPAVDEQPEAAQDQPAAGRFAVVCLSPQPWEIDLPTNRQQIMRRVAAAGHPVLYVETGTFAGRYVRRLFRSEQVTDGIRVLAAPNLAPWGHRLRRAAWVNARLTARAIRRALRDTAVPAVLWLYDPCLADAIGRSGERFAVYDCVDDYAEQTGTDARKRAFVSTCDAAAAARSRLVFATATPLVDRTASTTRARISYAMWATSAISHLRPTRRSLPRSSRPSTAPWSASPGTSSPRRSTSTSSTRSRRAGPTGRSCWLGPVPGGHRGAAGARGRAAERAPLREPHGTRSCRAYVAGFDVAVIPYLANAYTRSCFPLKTFEYLAAGKPVVATGLPELGGMEPHVVVADGPDAFVAAVEEALARRSEADVDARQRLAAENTWETRAARLLDLVAAEL